MKAQWGKSRNTARVQHYMHSFLKEAKSEEALLEMSYACEAPKRKQIIVSEGPNRPCSLQILGSTHGL